MGHRPSCAPCCLVRLYRSCTNVCFTATGSSKPRSRRAAGLVERHMFSVLEVVAAAEERKGYLCRAVDSWVASLTASWSALNVDPRHELTADDFLRAVSKAWHHGVKNNMFPDPLVNGSMSLEWRTHCGQQVADGRDDPLCIFVTGAGRTVPMVWAWGVPAQLAAWIEKIVFDGGMRRTLEIGMLQGNTAYPILNAHRRLGKGGKHINLQPDPFSTADAVALTSIKRSGLHNCSRVGEHSPHAASHTQWV
eukprot:6076239-Prymnesium_polylepis.2